MSETKSVSKVEEVEWLIANLRCENIKGRCHTVHHPSYVYNRCYLISAIPLQNEVQIGPDLPFVSVVPRRFRIAYQVAGDIIYFGRTITR